jgi:hypothetical protein
LHTRSAPDADDIAKWHRNGARLRQADNLRNKSAWGGFDLDTSANFKSAEPVFNFNGKVRHPGDSAHIGNRSHAAHACAPIKGARFLIGRLH